MITLRVIAAYESEPDEMNTFQKSISI